MKDKMDKLAEKLRPLLTYEGVFDHKQDPLDELLIILGNSGIPIKKGHYEEFDIFYDVALSDYGLDFPKFYEKMKAYRNDLRTTYFSNIEKYKDVCFTLDKLVYSDFDPVIKDGMKYLIGDRAPSKEEQLLPLLDAIKASPLGPERDKMAEKFWRIYREGLIELTNEDIEYAREKLANMVLPKYFALLYNDVWYSLEDVIAMNDDE
jgi:hypothetical protein